MKKIKLKINADILNIVVVTVVIVLILCILPILFLDNSNKINIFNIQLDDIKKSEDKNIEFPSDGKVKVYIKEENKVIELDLEDYITGVVASEMPANFNEEALKAQAIAARTYYMNKRKKPCKDSEANGAEICDTTNCQVYMNKEKRLKLWSSSKGEENWSKIKNAVDCTRGQIMTYDGYVLEYPQFFSTSSGKTEDAKDVFSVDVPYLKSEESQGEEIAPKYESTCEFSIDDFVKKVNSSYIDANLTKSNLPAMVSIKSYTEGGSVKEIQIGEILIKGTDFRKIFGLNSSNFNIQFTNNQVIIKCRGYGHGVGMSQWGANVMAKNGFSYEQILKHYYRGIEIESIKYI
ncbi:stage II sporulation protein D [Clostridium sp. SM-530-WT-3G]|uniref:stage II sporulation protein D n=1 Tax=Clostridium sp. SM-530-WT-3G TaxID=2725303 RepID=UPI001FACFE5C|nr:stage II sporulation protein D [Clostridium sp. SM-530-WT-3G]